LSLFVIPLALAVAGVLHAQPRGLILCQGIATRLRAVSDWTAGSRVDLLDVVTTGDHPYVELAKSSGFDVNPFPRGETEADFARRFEARFGPSTAVLASAREGLLYNDRAVIDSLPGGLNVIVDSGGSANCQHFNLFRTTAGGSALLPELPLEDPRSSENVICDGHGHSGYLARVNGVEAFLEYTSPPTDWKYRFWVVPLENDQWQNACWVDVDFHSVFNVTRTFVAKDSPVSEGMLRAAAFRIVKRWVEMGELEITTFGPPVPLRDRARADEMRLAEATGQERDLAIPTFGHDEALKGNLLSFSSSELYTLVLRGHTYLMRLGRAGWGWRVSTDSLVVLYPVSSDDRLAPVASAVVAQNRSELKSIRVRAGY
jgi:hypothetical protein